MEGPAAALAKRAEHKKTTTAEKKFRAKVRGEVQEAIDSGAVVPDNIQAAYAQLGVHIRAMGDE